MKKEIQDALNLVDQVVAAYRGNLQEHSALQKAMQVLKEELEPKKKEDVKPTK